VAWSLVSEEGVGKPGKFFGLFSLLLVENGKNICVKTFTFHKCFSHDWRQPGHD